MKIFLDTACPHALRCALSTAFVDGVTTNPSLLACTTGHSATEEPSLLSTPSHASCGTTLWEKHEESLHKWNMSKAMWQKIALLCHMSPGPISVQVWSPHAQEMIDQGKVLAQLHPHVVIKVPATVEGFRACHVLSHDHRIPVNVTLCFSAAQALLAAKAGAHYISPFLGRLEDWAQSQNNPGTAGIGLVEAIARLFAQHQISTMILAASIRNTHHALQALAAGAHAVTLPPAVFWELFSHPLTTKGLENFQHHWQWQETMHHASGTQPPQTQTAPPLYHTPCQNSH